MRGEVNAGVTAEKALRTLSRGALPSPAALTEGTLASDVQFLDELLSTVIERLAGADTLELIAETRTKSKRLRDAPSIEGSREVRDWLGGFDVPTLRRLSRAFSVYFDLVNLAEQRARLRALRRHAQSEASAPDGLEIAFRKLRDRGVQADELIKLLDRALVAPVFTAHPSEARRRTILEKLAAISRQMDAIELTQQLPRERESAVGAIVEEVESFWLSSLTHHDRPTVLDEVRQGLTMVQSLIVVTPLIYREMERAITRVYPELESTQLPSLLRFGTWIGGDRDGNPRVTPNVTLEAIRTQQETILKEYLQRLDQLGQRLSLSDREIGATPALLDSLASDAEKFPDLIGGPSHEPFRRKCRLISIRLRKTLEASRQRKPTWTSENAHRPAGEYLYKKELLDDLGVMVEGLESLGASACECGQLKDMVRLVDVFGLHMMTLDVRQHSDKHRFALEEILAWAGVCPDYTKRTANERVTILVEALEENRPLVPTLLPFSEATQEVVNTFRTIAAILEQQCGEAIENYIISNACEPAHVLEVLVLAREARLFDPRSGVSRLNIIPLFEAQAPLNSAATIIQRLLSLPIYRKHLELRGDLQEVMIGYSDSNKETGFLQSAWALYQAQRALADIERRTGLTVQIFHGRGGAIGRGGGPANRAILAQPAGTVNGRLRFTEQGEMVFDRFGLPGIAERHLEQILNAVFRASFAGESDLPQPTWERMLERIAEKASAHYRKLVYQNPEFVTYFEQATPIEEIGQLKLASRPTRRPDANAEAVDRLHKLRAIPWVFSWMQCRHTLPGWYGLGSAVEEYLVERPEDRETLKKMYEEWPFWRTLMDNAQMILAKADMSIARLYADLVSDKALGDRIFKIISDEHQRTVDVVAIITGQKGLLDDMPVLKKSIERRNPLVDPLSFIQLALLRRLRAEPEGSDEILQGVLESINGVASGLKNTG